MKAQEVILRAIAKQITWWQASEIIGISDWQLRRRQRRYEEHGYTGLIDRRRGRVSERQVPRTTVEEVLRLYKEQYFDFNVRHFHEKLVADHNIKLSYTWVKRTLQRAGLVKKDASAGCIASAGRAAPCPRCWSTLIVVNISGSVIIAGTPCWW